MSKNPDRDPLELLADDFISRIRRHEQPAVDTYAAEHPGLADEIRNLFPAVVAMEQFRSGRLEQGEKPLDTSGDHPTVLGDFRVLREVGRGGMGIVYEAEQISLQRRVALKILPRHVLCDARRLRRFQREAQTAARLHHTNIVPIFGVGHHEGHHFFVMQFIDGMGLEKVIARARAAVSPASGEPGSTADGCAGDARDDQPDSVALLFATASSSASGATDSGTEPSADRRAASESDAATAASTPSTIHAPPIKDDTSNRQSATASDAESPAHRPAAVQPGRPYWKRVAEIGMQVAEALHYAHQQGTLHRDIKPANLMIDQRGVVWVTDFGLARAMEHSDISHTSDLVGTLHYMAPERFAGRVDARSDIYGLGLTLYELVTFRPGFADADRNKLIQDITTGQLAPPRSIDSRVPRDLETIILKATSCEPEHRYATAGALAEDLKNFADDRPIQARRISPAERVWRWCRRNRAVAGLGMTAVLLLALVAVVSAWSYVRTRQALTAEKSQRHRAEATAELALEAIDRIYDQFAPHRMTTVADLDLNDDEQEASFTAPVQPVLSNDVATLLENMLGFYGRLAEQQGIDEVTFRMRIAEAHGRVGDIRQRLGDFDRAADAYRRALDIYRRLESDVTQVAVPREMARIHNELGNVYRRARRWRAAYEAHTDALRILEPLAQARSAVPALQFELARTHYLLGRQGPRVPPGGPSWRGPSARTPRSSSSPSQRSRVESAAHGSKSRESASSRDAADTERAPTVQEKSARHNGMRHYETAITILESLDEDSALAPDGRHLLARCYRDMAYQLDRSERLAAQRMATALLESLVEEFPDVADYRFGLCQTYLRLGRHSMRSQQAEEREAGERQLRAALDMMTRLVAEHPQVTDYRTTVAYTYHLLARELVRCGRVDDAERNFRRASEAYAFLVERYPHTPAYVFGRCWSHIGLAILLRDRHAWEEAQQLLDASADAVERALNSDDSRSASHPFAHRLLESVYRTKAEGFAARQQTTEATESTRVADFHAQKARESRGRGRLRGVHP